MSNKPKIFDLAISYEWEFDTDFVNLIEYKLQSAGFTTYVIMKYNLQETIEKLSNKEISFIAYLDRAGDVDEDFAPLTNLLIKKKTYLINPYSKIVNFINKAKMHNLLLRNKINVPFTIILPSLKSKQDTVISLKEWEFLGKPFVIKPAFYTGGKEGVIVNANSLFEVLEERKKLPDDRYLIQKKIYPKYLDGKRAWFRVIWAFGEAIPAWWNDLTDIYQVLTDEEIEHYDLYKLIIITKKIAAISQIDYFSTEIALAEDNEFYVIDYLNDQCDMRFQSKFSDGVPDSIVHKFIDKLGEKVRKLKKSYHLQ